MPIPYSKLTLHFFWPLPEDIKNILSLLYNRSLGCYAIRCVSLTKTKLEAKETIYLRILNTFDTSRNEDKRQQVTTLLYVVITILWTNQPTCLPFALPVFCTCILRIFRYLTESELRTEDTSKMAIMNGVIEYAISAVKGRIYEYRSMSGYDSSSFQCL